MCEVSRRAFLAGGTAFLSLAVEAKIAIRSHRLAVRPRTS